MKNSNLINKQRNNIYPSMLILIILLNVTYSANGQQYANLTDVHLQIFKDNKISNEIDMVLIDNNKASIQFFNDITKAPIAKIYVTSNKLQHDPRKLISINLEYWIYENGVWRSLSQSSILNEAGVESSIKLSNGLKALEIYVNATTSKTKMLITELQKLDFNQCEFNANTINYLSSQKDNKLPKKCCSSACTDGSGQTMTCCGAITCSDCGTECSP